MTVKTNFEQQLFELPDGNAIAFGGRWHGWMFTKHPDGQWVSIRKCDQIALPDTAPWFGIPKVMQPLSITTGK